MSSAAARIEDVGDELFADELKPGTQLLMGQFTIESFLNSGGFGITYLAKDSLDRRVVIKECFPASFCRRSANAVGARTRQRQDEFRSIVKLFVQEAFNLSRLDHPYIVKVHQVFEDNETAYMAMDYIQGPDLLETLEGKIPRLTPDQIMSTLLRSLEAVGYVHDQGMLHRDISPDNILLDRTTGNPVLIDFGASRKEVNRKSRALSGLRVVKDGYSPQEFYIAGSKQAPCSDLYALAASFYHLITNETPKTSQERLSAIANREADPHKPLSGHYSAYPPAFLAAIDKAMSIFPRDRLQSVVEWQAMLRGIPAPEAVTQVPEAPARRSPSELDGLDAMIAASVRASLQPEPKPAPISIPVAAKAPVVAAVVSAPPVAEPAPISRPVSRPVSVQASLPGPTRGSRDLLMASAAAILLLAGLLALPARLGERWQDPIVSAAEAGSTVALAAVEPAAAFVPQRAVRLPFVADTADATVVAALLPDSPVWMQPGQRIVEVNGQPVQDAAALPAMLAQGADLAKLTELKAIIGFEAAQGADIVRKMETLPVVSQLRLDGGLVFDMIESATGTRTVVAFVPDGTVTDLRVGDVLLVYLASGESIGTTNALGAILERELAVGVATYSFAVLRLDSKIDATFQLKGGA